MGVIPSSRTHCTAESINGAAVPYGSKSTTSTRCFGCRCEYINALPHVNNGFSLLKDTYQASPSLTLTSAEDFVDASPSEGVGPRLLIWTFRRMASQAASDRSFAKTYLTRQNIRSHSNNVPHDVLYLRNLLCVAN